MNAQPVGDGDFELWKATERYVLGAAMQSTEAYQAAAALVRGETFHEPAHEAIWTAIGSLVAAGTAEHSVTAGAVAVANVLESTGDLATVGGIEYLYRCQDEAVVPEDAAHYAGQVREASNRRRLAAIGQRLAAVGTDMTINYRDLASEAVPNLEAIFAAGSRDADGLDIGADYDEFVEALEGQEVRGFKSGIYDLDKHMLGFAPGHVTVVGARPRVGKTCVGIHIGVTLARAGRRVMVFSLEMGRRDLQYRILANMAHINSNRLHPTKPTLTQEDWERFAVINDEWVGLPLQLFERTQYTVEEMSARVGEAKRRDPSLALVVIDYLQLVRPSRQGLPRQEEIASISRAVKLMARRHGVHVFLLSQLNRNSESRTTKRPAMGDLRESGAIEQDADNVLLLHREDVYDPETDRVGEMDIVIEKNRYGESGMTIPVVAQLHYFRIGSLSHDGPDDIVDFNAA